MKGDKVVSGFRPIRGRTVNGDSILIVLRDGHCAAPEIGDDERPYWDVLCDDGAIEPDCDVHDYEDFMRWIELKFPGVRIESHDVTEWILR